MRKHGNLNFIPFHMNTILVETWVDFKLLSASITKDGFVNINILPFNHLTKTQTAKLAFQLLKCAKAGIKLIEKSNIVPKYIE